MASRDSFGSGWGLAIGVGLSALGSIQEGRAESKAGKRQAWVGRQNAKAAREQGAEDARRFRVYGRKQLGAGRAAVGASGIRLSGSAMEVIAENARNLELDAQTIEYEAELRAWNFEQGAKADAAQASTSRTLGLMDAASTVLTGISTYQSRQPSE